jgi:predicted DNA repair protein MutK
MTCTLFCLAFVLARAVKNQILPLLNKIDGALDNISAITLAARDQVEEFKTVIDDISYRTRTVAHEVHERVLPPITEIIAAFSGVARVILMLFGRKKS